MKPEQVAEMLTQRAMTRLNPNQDNEEADNSEEELQEEISEETQETDELDEPEVSEDQDVDEGDEDDEDEEEATSDAELELDDDYLITVKVDGEEQEVTLRDLIDRFAHSGAADKRLNEATKTLTEAKSARESSVQEAQKVRNATVKIIEQLDKSLHTPLVPPPPEALKSSNPSKYLQHLEAYNQDQQRIMQSKEALKSAFKEQHDVFEEMRQTRAQHEFQLVEQKLPIMRDPHRGKAAMSDMVEAGREVGFTDEEIASGADHRMYLLAYYANQYLKSKKGKVNLAATPNKGSKKLLRSGSTKASQRPSGQAKKVIQLKKQAQRTGRPDDVAAYLAARQKGA